MITKTINPHGNPELRLSSCCNARIDTCPACFGDPELHVCRECNKCCDEVWHPLYECVSKGTYRKIEYKTKKGDII